MFGWAEVFYLPDFGFFGFNISTKTCLEERNNQHWLTKCKPIESDMWVMIMCNVCKYYKVGEISGSISLNQIVSLLSAPLVNSYHGCKINHFNSWDNSESPHHFVQQQQHHVIENLRCNIFNVSPSFSELFFVAEDLRCFLKNWSEKCDWFSVWFCT